MKRGAGGPSKACASVIKLPSLNKNQQQSYSFQLPVHAGAIILNIKTIERLRALIC